MAFGFYEEGGADLPHAPIPLEVQLIVEDAMRLAWQRLRGRVPAKHNLATATEDEVTHDLFEILYDEVFAQGLVEGFDHERFTVVTREKKVRNFDGTMLDKMPDLHVGIAARENVFMLSQDGLFVESKPVDANHTVGVHYGAKGIARFIRGEYAWAMPAALMVGYASAGYQLDPKLIEALRDRATEFAVLAAPQPCPRSHAVSFSPAVHVSRHGRNFSYLETGLAAPPIQLRHLWLDRT
jgi:hypothetical protein